MCATFRTFDFSSISACSQIVDHTRSLSWIQRSPAMDAGGPLGIARYLMHRVADVNRLRDLRREVGLTRADLVLLREWRGQARQRVDHSARRPFEAAPAELDRSAAEDWGTSASSTSLLGRAILLDSSDPPMMPQSRTARRLGVRMAGCESQTISSEGRNCVSSRRCGSRRLRGCARCRPAGCGRWRRSRRLADS